MKQVLLENLGILLTSIATGVGAWIFSAKKTKADLETSQIENAEKLLNYYKNLADDLGARLERAIKEFNDAKNIISELEDKVEALTDELKKYKQLNGKKI